MLKIKKPEIENYISNFGLEFYLSNFLHGETFTASTGPAGIGVAEKETFSIEAIRKIKSGINEI